MKKTNKFHLTLQDAPGTGNSRTLELNIENHDDIFSIIERSRNNPVFDTPEQAAEFAIGLKLFSEVMLKHRGHSLFEEFAPAFGAFMQKLKAANKS